MALKTRHIEQNIKQINKSELVLSRYEQLLVRCYNKKVITFGGLTGRLEKMINKHGIKKMVQASKWGLKLNGA